MNFDFDSSAPGLTEKDVADILSDKRSLPEPGPYTMKVQSVRARITPKGTTIGEVFLVHAEDGKGGLKGGTVGLYRSKDNPNRNSEVTQKFLTVFGKALGLTDAQVATITWAPAKDAEAGQYGEIPAAIAIRSANGTYEPISLEGVQVKAVLDIRTYEKKDGSTGQAVDVKAIRLAD